MDKRLCKVCGLTRAEDVALCAELGVDFTGFIFAPASPRVVKPEFVASLPFGTRSPVRRVGVFAGTAPGEMRAIAEAAALDFFQLHGGESPEICGQLGAERVIKVLWPENGPLEELQHDMERFAPVCAYFLLDAGRGGGGGGNCLPFSRLAALKSPRPWLLAGGLGPETLATALSACSPDGVDLNSALEESPGLKNPDLLRQAVRLVKP